MKNQSLLKELQSENERLKADCELYRRQRDDHMIALNVLALAGVIPDDYSWRFNVIMGQVREGERKQCKLGNSQ